jgi:CBS domain-containing protein
MVSSVADENHSESVHCGYLEPGGTHSMRIELSLRHVEVLALELQPPLLLDESTSVGDTIRAMRGPGLGYALIVSGERLVGIFTERDVFLSVIGNPAVLPQAVTGFMTRDPITVSENDPIWRVVSRMHEGGFRQVPVLDDQGRAIACVRHKDIAQFMANHFPDHVLNLPPDPEQHARSQEGG